MCRPIDNGAIALHCVMCKRVTSEELVSFDIMLTQLVSAHLVEMSRSLLRSVNGMARTRKTSRPQCRHKQEELVSFDVMLTQLVLAYLLEIFFHLMQTAMVFSHEAGHDN